MQCNTVLTKHSYVCFPITASDVSTLDDLDELEVYGSDSQQQTGAKITQYTFEVRRHGDLFI